MGFGAIFLFFGFFFPIFWGRPKPTFFLFFSISGRRPEMGCVPGKQDRKTGSVGTSNRLLTPATPRFVGALSATPGLAKGGVWALTRSPPGEPNQKWPICEPVCENSQESQKDYLPNPYSRRTILGNSICFMCTKENFYGKRELIILN